jgi:hypothetical protein
VAASSEPDSEFLELEYAAILSKMAATRADISKTETLYPFAVVALYAWLLTHTQTAPWLWRVGMCLPAAIGILAFVRLRGRMKSMELLERYSRRIETHFHGNSGWGWEHAYADDRPMQWVARVRWLVGVGFVLFTLIVALWACTSERLRFVAPAGAPISAKATVPT